MENTDYQKINLLIKEISKYIKREDSYRAARSLERLTKHVKICQNKKNQN
jgi:hypothetical protein